MDKEDVVGFLLKNEGFVHFECMNRDDFKRIMGVLMEDQVSRESERCERCGKWIHSKDRVSKFDELRKKREGG